MYEVMSRKKSVISIEGFCDNIELPKLALVTFQSPLWHAYLALGKMIAPHRKSPLRRPKAFSNTSKSQFNIALSVGNEIENSLNKLGENQQNKGLVYSDGLLSEQKSNPSQLYGAQSCSIPSLLS